MGKRLSRNSERILSDISPKMWEVYSGLDEGENGEVPQVGSIFVAGKRVMMYIGRQGVFVDADEDGLNTYYRSCRSFEHSTYVAKHLPFEVDNFSTLVEDYGFVYYDV